jgi:hypothetical protein
VTLYKTAQWTFPMYGQTPSSEKQIYYDLAERTFGCCRADENPVRPSPPAARSRRRGWHDRHKTSSPMMMSAILAMATAVRRRRRRLSSA